jgi:hypothetical protein
MSFKDWRGPILIAIGALLLLSTGIGLLLQHEDAQRAFLLLVLAQATLQSKFV